MKTSTVVKLLEACSTALNGGPTDPPDHCCWAVDEIIKALRAEEVTFTNSQQEQIKEFEEMIERYG